MSHPHDLLADYVDGALDAEVRARVQAHLVSCASCAEEVALAGEAVAAVRMLPEVPAPFGIAQRAMRDAERPRAFDRPIMWRVAGVAAAAALVAGAFVFFGGREPMEQQAAAPSGGSEPDAAATRDASGGGDTTAGSPALSAEAARLAFPAYSKANRDYTSEALNERTLAIAADARAALGQGFPPTAQQFYASFDLKSLPKPAQVALGCVNRGVPPDRSVVPFVIEDARFQSAPAHLVTYLRGDTADAPYDRLQLLVASRETCTILHFARQRL